MSHDSSDDTLELEIEAADLSELSEDLDAYMTYAGVPAFNDKGIRSQVLYLTFNYLAESGALVATCSNRGEEYTQPGDKNPLCLPCWLVERKKVIVTT